MRPHNVRTKSPNSTAGLAPFSPKLAGQILLLAINTLELPVTTAKVRKRLTAEFKEARQVAIHNLRREFISPKTILTQRRDERDVDTLTRRLLISRPDLLRILDFNHEPAHHQ